MISHFLIFSVLVAICLSSCSSDAAPELRPGDKIGDMLLTTGAAKAVPLRYFCLPGKEINGVMAVECNPPRLSRISIGDAFGVPEAAQANLDWSTPSWELSVDNQPVDLAAFGIYHTVLPGMTLSPARIREVFREITTWDVVLENLNPGVHTLRGLVNTRNATYKWFVDIHCQ